MNDRFNDCVNDRFNDCVDDCVRLSLTLSIIFVTAFAITLSFTGSVYRALITLEARLDHV